MRFSIASLATLVSIAYADDSNGADESGGGSLRNIHPSLPSFVLSPSSIKTKKQPPTRDRSKFIEMRSRLRKKLSRRRRPGVLRNSVADEVELNLPEPLELCGKHSLGILHGAHGACSSEEDVCVHVDEQGTESSWITPYDENSETYGICLPRSLAETHHFQPVYSDDAAVYMEEDHRLLMPQAATCDVLCPEPRYVVEKNGAEFRQLISDCYLNDLCPKLANDERATVINCWDTSKVDSMEAAFYDLIYFNEPLQCWNTSGVTSMSRMFAAKSAAKGTYFNESIDSWDVGQVRTMSKMFYHCDFDRPIDMWDVSSVTDMSYMFADTGYFNHPLGNWNTSSVKTMKNMFNVADFFNQPIGNWNVGSVTDMSSMFEEASSHNSPMNDWDVSQVIDMSSMFANARVFYQRIDEWNVSMVQNMSSMFAYTYVDYSIAPWSVSNVLDMSSMFKYAYNFNQSIDEWDVSSVLDMSSMFTTAENFNQCLSTWASKTSATVATDNMFKDSGCPNDSVEPDVAPWCQRESDGCLAPSFAPTSTPSELPSSAPSHPPTLLSSSTPSDTPTPAPSDTPTTSPSDSPSHLPTLLSSSTPTTAGPSHSPTLLSSSTPTTAGPSATPITTPSHQPSIIPSTPYTPTAIPKKKSAKKSAKRTKAPSVVLHVAT